MVVTRCEMLEKFEVSCFISSFKIWCSERFSVCDCSMRDSDEAMLTDGELVGLL